MPAPYETPIPGGANTDMGIVHNGLSAPGRQEQPRTERIDQLRNLLVTAGASIAGAVQSDARVQAMAQQRRDERIAESRRLASQVAQKKDDALNAQELQYKQNMKDRLQGIEQVQYTILRDPRSTSSEWVMNQAILRQDNAGSDFEKQAWNDFIIRHQMASREDTKQEGARIAREANRQLTDDQQYAAKTGQQAIDILAAQINEDPKLEQQLLGDGRGITDRVYDYAYKAAIQSAPDLFTLDKRDPMYAQKKRAGDELLVEMESRALHAIVNPLLKKAGKQQEQASEVAGQDMVETQQLAYAEGRISADQYHDAVGDIIRVKFAHLDPDKKDELRTKLYTTQFNRLVGMLDGNDPGNALKKMEGLLSVADLNSAEKNAIRENIIADKFPNAVANNVSQQFASAENDLRTVNVGPKGEARASDPRKAMIDMLRSPDGKSGSSRYMDIAAQQLDKLGIKPGVPLTPLQANLQMSVLGEVEKAEQKARLMQKQIDGKVDVGVRLRQGAALTSEEGSKAWNGGWSMSAFNGGMTPEDSVYQTLAGEYRQRFGKDIPWDGTSPLVLDDKTADIGVMMAREDAEAWRNNTATPLPGAVGDRIKQFSTSGTPAQVKWALNFYQALGPAGQERLGKTLGVGKDGIWANAALIEGSRLAFNPRAIEQGQDFAAVANRMRNITESMTDTANYRAIVDAGLKWEKEPAKNTEAAKALERALKAKPEEGGFGVKGKGDTTEDHILSLIGDDRENLGALYQRAYIVQALNPSISMDTAMSTVVAEMRTQGYTVSDSDRGRVIIRDPFNHTAYEPKESLELLSDFDKWRNFPVDTKYSYGMKNIMATRLTERALGEYGAAIHATPEDIQFAKERGQSKDWLLYAVLKREGATDLPLPSEWAWRPAPMSGTEFNSEMSRPDGGIPMILEMPGYKPMNSLYYGGRALHTFSATRLSDAQGSLVNRHRIVDNHLSSPMRTMQVLPMREDSADRVGSLLKMASERTSRE